MIALARGPSLTPPGPSPMMAPTIARGGRDLERREEVRHRRGQPQLPVDVPARGARSERISSSARGSGERRPRSCAIVTGKNVRYVAMTMTEVSPKPKTMTRMRRERHDRDRLAGDDVRQERALAPSVECTKSDASATPMSAPSAKPMTASCQRVERRTRRGSRRASRPELRWNGLARARPRCPRVRQLAVARLEQPERRIVEVATRWCPGCPRGATGHRPSHLKASQTIAAMPRNATIASAVRATLPSAVARRAATTSATGLRRRRRHGGRSLDPDRRPRGRRPPPSSRSDRSALTRRPRGRPTGPELGAHALVGVLEGPVDDVEALRELVLGDRERRVVVDRVEAHERVEPVVAQVLARPPSSRRSCRCTAPSARRSRGRARARGSRTGRCCGARPRSGASAFSRAWWRAHDLAHPRRPLDEAVLLVDRDRRERGRAAHRVAVVRQAAEEGPVARTPRRSSGASPPRRAAGRTR